MIAEKRNLFFPPFSSLPVRNCIAPALCGSGTTSHQLVAGICLMHTQPGKFMMDKQSTQGMSACMNTGRPKHSHAVALGSSL